MAWMGTFKATNCLSFMQPDRTETGQKAQDDVTESNYLQPP
jgi:hypothetical protein